MIFPSRFDSIPVELRLLPTVVAKFSCHLAHLLTAHFFRKLPSISKLPHSVYKSVSEVIIIILAVIGLQRGRGKGQHPYSQYMYSFNPQAHSPGLSLPFHQELNPAKLGAYLTAFPANVLILSSRCLIIKEEASIHVEIFKRYTYRQTHFLPLMDGKTV